MLLIRTKMFLILFGCLFMSQGVPLVLYSLDIMENTFAAEIIDEW